MYNKRRSYLSNIWTLSIIKNMEVTSGFLLPDGSIFSQYNSHKGGSFIDILYNYEIRIFKYLYNNLLDKEKLVLISAYYKDDGLSGLGGPTQFFSLNKYTKAELFQSLKNSYNYLYERLLFLEDHKCDGDVIFLSKILLRQYINRFFDDNNNRGAGFYKSDFLGDHPVNRDVFNYIYNLIKGELLICRFFLNLTVFTDDPAIEFIKYLKLYGMKESEIDSILFTGRIDRELLVDQLVNLIGIDKIETQSLKTITTGETHRSKVLDEYITLGYQIKKIPSFSLDTNSKQIIKKQEYYPF